MFARILPIAPCDAQINGKIIRELDRSIDHVLEEPHSFRERRLTDDLLITFDQRERLNCIGEAKFTNL